MSTTYTVTAVSDWRVTVLEDRGDGRTTTWELPLTWVDGPVVGEPLRGVSSPERVAQPQDECRCPPEGFCGAGSRCKDAPQVAQPVSQEPVYYVTVQGRLQDHTPAPAAFDLPDGRHALYAAPQVAQPPSEADAYEMGTKGASKNDGERRAFEAWMKGHCWALSAHWDGKQYISDGEQGGWPDPQATMTRRLWAAWRDRAALEAAPAAPQVAQPLTHAYTIELPEGDTRTAIVRFSERKADGSVMRHHLCVSVKPAPVAPPLTRSQREAVFAVAQEAMYADPELSWRHAIITATERAHGIGQEAAPQVAQPQPKPLTDEQILACVESVLLPKPMGLTRDRGPYEVTEPSVYLQLLVRAIERAHGIGQEGGAA